MYIKSLSDKKKQTNDDIVDQKQYTNFDLAKEYHNSGRLQEALNIYVDILKYEPANCEVLSLLGFLALQIEKNKQSIELLTKAISIKKNSEDKNVPQDWYAWLGIAYLRVNLFDEAAACYMEKSSDPYIKNHFFDELERIFVHNGRFPIITKIQMVKYKDFYYRSDIEILRQLKINFVSEVYSQNIGLMTYIHIYIKMNILGWYPCENPILILHERCPNQCYLNYLRPFFSYIISDKLLKKSLEPLSSRVEVKHLLPFTDGHMLKFATDWATKIQNQWNLDRRSALLTLTEFDCERGQNCLKKMGIPSNAWFVCLHVRDIREGGMNTRNADIMTYKMAIQTICEKGGWVIRMGGSSMPPLPKMHNVIDYVHTEFKSDWMDVFLWAKCKFFIGTTSGPAAIPISFGVPSITTNLVPLFSRPWYNDLFIPKLIWSNKLNRFLTFSEILSSPVGFAFYERDILSQGCKLIDNSPEDINDLVLEMLSIIDGNIKYTKGDNDLQNKFNNLEMNIDYNNQKIQGLARIGQKFSHKYYYLF